MPKSYSKKEWGTGYSLSEKLLKKTFPNTLGVHIENSHIARSNMERAFLDKQGIKDIKNLGNYVGKVNINSLRSKLLPTMKFSKAVKKDVGILLKGLLEL